MYFDPRWAAGHDLHELARRWRRLAPPTLRPALWSRFGALAWTGPDGLAPLIESIYDDFENELAATDLACLGLDLVGRGRPEPDRLAGCVWLTLFPSVEAVTTLAAILRDPTESHDLRDQAAWTLGFRQIQQRAPSLCWSAEAIALADGALADAFFADPEGELTQLLEACQHVHDPRFHDRLAADLVSGALFLDRACDAVDGFASPALATALLERLPALRPDHAGAVIPLVAHTLGADAAPELLAFAELAPIAPRCEALWGALAFAPDDAAAAIAALVAANPMMPQLAARAAWHREHPRVVPLTRGLQIARTTATLPGGDRAPAARLACGYFAALAALESPVPGDAFALWRHVAYLAAPLDPAAIVTCAQRDRHALDRAGFLLPRLLDALARQGRFLDLARTAAARGETSRATWLLARGGRPHLALAMRRLARGDDLHALAGQALALFAAGRPDLAVLTRALPLPAGPDEAWRANRDPEADLLRAWMAPEPLAALAGLGVAAPPGADPDLLDLDAIAALDRALRADLAGSSVHLAGRFADRAAVRTTIEGRGGLVVSGPFGKVDYVLVGDEVDPSELARLTSLGAIPLPASHLSPAPSRQEPEMPPLHYPHRVSFLASGMTLSPQQEHLSLLPAKLFASILFDHLIRHPIVSVGDFDDERLTDDDDQLIDARHQGAEEAIDWFFRVGRRQEVLWVDLSLDPARPAAVRLRSRRPSGPIEEWASIGGNSLSEQLSQVLDQWLETRKLPPAGPMTPFTVHDVVDITTRLDRALVAGRPTEANPEPPVPEPLIQPPPRLAVAFFRVLADMAAFEGNWDQRILAVDPKHPVARRNVFLASLSQKTGGDRRAILPVTAEAPMYGKPHLSVWGEAFENDREDEGMGVRHQGIAAMLIPSNPWACHNYSIQLHEEYRREESYRWCDRATIASPSFNNAHLDCVRRLRNVQRPGQAFAEATFRCNDILERWNSGKVSPFEWPAKYHAGMLLAFVHHDVGRLDEAIKLATDAMADMEDPESGHESFGWAIKKIRAWQSDPKVLGQAYAWEGYHRADPGRVVEGFGRAGVSDHDDVYMLIDALIATGREDLALVAFHHYQGVSGAGVVGDGKGRLAGARAHLLAGDVHDAMECIQIVQLRRTQSRLEPEINRLLRLATCRSADEWEAVVAKRLEQGALTLARRAARDLADFIPDMQRPAILRALGERTPWQVDPAGLLLLASVLPKLGAAGAAIDERLAAPPGSEGATLAAADVLGQEWWTVLPPPNRDREAHASAAIYALGVALVRYLSTTSGPPTPIGGAYRHVATEALHLVRRSRYHIEDEAVRGLLVLLDGIAPKVEEWLFDTWLLRVEHAFDLDTENGSYLPDLIAGLPNVGSLMRGDERIGWELRMAWDLRTEPNQLDASRILYERCARALETGSTFVEWSNVADATLPPHLALDVHWTAAIANPTSHAEPWVNLARAQFIAGRGVEAVDSLCRAFTTTGDDWRRDTIKKFEASWQQARLEIPFGFDAAQSTGLAALQAGNLDLALGCMRWCQAQDPKNGVIAKNLGIIYGAMGRAHDAVRAFAGFDKADPGKHAGTALMQAQKYSEAVLAFRYAAQRFTGPEDWRLLAVAGWYAEDDAISAWGYEQMLAAGAAADTATLHGLASALYNTGQWVRCEEIARQLIQAAGNDPTYRSCGLHAMARALAGKGQFGDAVRCAMEAAQLNPLADNKVEFDLTVQTCQAQQVPPFKSGPETSIERQAWNALGEGDFAKAEQLAVTGNSWGLFRAALAASEFRAESDNHVPVSGKALEAALMVLDRTVGNPLADAAMCRIRALRLRENAFIQIDPPPPLGVRMRREDFAKAWKTRSAGAAGAAPGPLQGFDQARAVREAQGAAAAAQAGLAGDADPTVFPGTKVAKLSDYVSLMKSMQTGDMMGALSRAGLDMGAYMTVATQWGQKLAVDATLNAKYAQMMQR